MFFYSFQSPGCRHLIWAFLGPGGKLWEWSLSTVVRILRTGWVRYCTCVWNNVAWPRKSNCNCVSRPAVHFCVGLICYHGRSLKLSWLVAPCSHYPLCWWPLCFNYTLLLPHETGARQMTFSLFSEGEALIHVAGCLTSPVDLGSCPNISLKVPRASH